MRMQQSNLVIQSQGRGTQELTARVDELVRGSGVVTGLCHLFLQHTSASLILCENADPSVRDDLETFMAAAVRDGDPRFSHRQEGADDMSAHIRSILTGTSLELPVARARLALGTWQGVYLWEHRARPRRRTLVVTVWGRAS